ncbi:hypothetical protein F5887DRAFT_78146 [Amanita rubescens]|nr:hypothetical protein F5887DRAFT_78146 [Amanita rubescens]
MSNGRSYCSTSSNRVQQLDWYKYYVGNVLDSMLSFVEIHIIAMASQALLTGVYFASFLLCLRWLIFSDDGEALRKPIHRPYLIITIFLFTCSVIGFSISLQATLLVFEGRSGKSYYTTVVIWFIKLLTPIITDSVLIFRCWMVYNRSWRIAALPLVLSLYNISSLLVMTVYWSVTISGAASKCLLYPQRGILESYYGSTTIINIYATSAIILQIRKNCLSRSFSRFAIRLITESGLLYTLTSIAAFFTLLFSPTDILLLTSAINFPVAGIAYNLILIRVAENRAKPEPSELPTFIGESTIERAIPSVPRNQSETVAS